MKRVLVISQNFYPEIGSAANRIKNIYIELQQKGYAVQVLTTEPSYPNRNIYKDAQFWNENIQENDIIRIRTNTRKYTRNMLNRFLLYLEVLFKLIFTIISLKKEYDYIFVTTPPIFVGFAGVFAKWKLKAPLILDVRDLWPESLLGVGVFTNKLVLRFSYFLERKLLHSADKIVVNSEGFISYITNKGIKPKDISFIPNSLTEEELHLSSLNDDTVHDKRITVIYTGNIGLAQDILSLIELAEKFKEKETLYFKIIGYGFRRNEIERIIKEKNLINIELVQVKNRRDTLYEVSRADIAYVGLVDEKVFETVLPGKIMDYMCMKKPIIGNVNGYSKEIVQKANCGFITNDRSVNELFESICLLSDNDRLRKELGQNGYFYAKEHLRWKNNIKILLSIFNDKR